MPGVLRIATWNLEWFASGKPNSSQAESLGSYECREGRLSRTFVHDEHQNESRQP
jgi:hypothetical protein